MMALYRRLLRLYPPLYRYCFADEMLAVLGELEADAARKGPAARGLFRAREVAGLLGGAAREQLRELAPAGWSFATRSPLMRETQRYSWTSVALMALILGLVMMAIGKGSALASFESSYKLLAPIAICFALAWTGGALVWAVRFALRRSGVHRLDEAHTWPQN